MSMITGTYLFCAKRSEIESHQLPPCKDCLANQPTTKLAVGRGWKIEKDGADEHLVIHWMDGQPAPQAILDLLACNCSKSVYCRIVNGLKCTDMCRVPDCENQASVVNIDTDDDLEDDCEY